ncbi:hypothetical protein BJY52DRAFT_1190585 [Lactarius psammicola]|nr:hypothetical protein BJY52DRAFT_1190585 [Lactarius psammicola]
MSPTRRNRQSVRAIDDESGQPRSRVRRVILHVSQPSAPDPPPPTSQPPPEVHDVPQAPPPPPPPPHLPPPVAGLPIPNDGQHGLAGPPMNAPLTYAHPYGAMVYPPAYPPVLHHPYGTSVGAAPQQPWDYAHAVARFLARGHVANGPVNQDTPGREDMGVLRCHNNVA